MNNKMDAIRPAVGKKKVNNGSLGTNREANMGMRRG